VARLGKRYPFVVTPFPEGRSREAEQFGSTLDVGSIRLERLLGIPHFFGHKRAIITRTSVSDAMEYRIFVSNISRKATALFSMALTMSRSRTDSPFYPQPRGADNCSNKE